MIQNDAYHKIKNTKKDRDAKFRRPNIEAQKMYMTPNDVRHSGLLEIASQLNIDLSILSKKDRFSLINVIDPKLRALYKVFYVVVGNKSISTLLDREDNEII